MLLPFRLFAMALITAVLAVASILVAAFDRGGRRSSAIVGAWARAMMACAGVQVRLEGGERLDDLGPCLFVSSHQSTLDIPALLAVLPPTTRFLAKAELFRVPLFGQAIRLLGFVPIKRTDTRAARRSLEQVAELSAANRPILIFPEGTRGNGSELLPFKKGAFAVALERQLKVVPVACLGGASCMPANSLRIRPGTMTVRIGETLAPEDVPEGGRAALAALVRERMVLLSAATAR